MCIIILDSMLKIDNSDTGDATPADEAVPLEKEDA
jgi:hypothetical protein